MKKLIALAIVLALLILCVGCSNNNVDNTQATVDTSQADTYIEMAQDFIDKGDYDAAVDVLQRGYSATNDERIAVMLAEVLSNTGEDSDSSQPPSVNEDNTTDDSSKPEDESNTAAAISLTDYEGIWANESICWEEGGIYVDIYSLEGEMVSGLWYYIEVTSVQAAPGCRIASISTEYDTDEIQGDTLSIEFEDDWGNCGTVILQFIEDDSIVCKVTDFDGDSYASWGLYEGEWVLFRNDDVYDLLQEDVTEPTYDTSKASGILAQAGLTEQGFRNICTYINNEFQNDNDYVYAAGRQYYAEHPDENILLDHYTEDWVSYQELGTQSPNCDQYNEDDLRNSNSLDDYLNRKIYGPKGASILGKRSDEYFEAMQEYPANYINQPFLLKDFRVESIYDYTYSLNNYILYDTTVKIVDYRDDVNYPNILNKTYYDMYVIFLGTQGSDTFVFALISAEKSK